METPAGAIYHVARDGQVIGAFPFPTLAAKFKDGSVKASDHYLVEGTSDWKLVGELKPQFTEHERQLKAEADRKAAEAKAAKEAAEAEAAKAKALEIEAEQLRRQIEAQEAAKRRIAEEEKNANQFWQCHTCGSRSRRRELDDQFPEASGLMQSVGCLALGCIFAALSVSALREMYNPAGSLIMCFILGLLSCLSFAAALGFVIAHGTERGLQQFNSYRPRCPNCSSPYCSKQPE